MSWCVWAHDIRHHTLLLFWSGSCCMAQSRHITVIQPYYSNLGHDAGYNHETQHIIMKGSGSCYIVGGTSCKWFEAKNVTLCNSPSHLTMFSRISKIQFYVPNFNWCVQSFATWCVCELHLNANFVQLNRIAMTQYRDIWKGKTKGIFSPQIHLLGMQGFNTLQHSQYLIHFYFMFTILTSMNRICFANPVKKRLALFLKKYRPIHSTRTVMLWVQ